MCVNEFLYIIVNRNACHLLPPYYGVVLEFEDVFLFLRNMTLKNFWSLFFEPLYRNPIYVSVSVVDTLTFSEIFH